METLQLGHSRMIAKILGITVGVLMGVVFTVYTTWVTEDMMKHIATARKNKKLKSDTISYKVVNRTTRDEDIYTQYP